MLSMASQPDGTSPAVSDRKKRALEALERRFASPNSGGRQDQQSAIKKIKRGPKDEPEARIYDSSSAKPDHTPHKGNPVFSGYRPRGEVSGSAADQQAHPAYSELLQMVHENLLKGSTKDSSKEETVDKVVRNLLQRGDKGLKYIRGGRSMKVDSWIHLDNFVPKDTAMKDARVRALQSHSKRSRRHMSMRQHRKCGTFDLPKEFHSFDLFKRMHEMWKEYVIELLKTAGKKPLAQRLLMADLHGAILLVAECKVIAYKGVTGIMVRETEETFGIITKDNQFRGVPKKGSVFIFQADCWKITLHGDKLSLRNTGT